MLIGVISDTHFPNKTSILPAQVNEVFKKVDLILHAGDIHTREVLKFLSNIAPTIAVAGNGDDPEMAYSLGYSRTIYVEGYEIGLAHGHHGYADNDAIMRACNWFSTADIVVGGHSHIPCWKKLESGVHYLNPGSCGAPKGDRESSVALLRIEKNNINAEIILLDK